LVAAVNIGRAIMRRFSVVLSVVAIFFLGVVALQAQPVAVAQEATPSSDMEMEPEGVTFEPLAITSGVTLPSPADLIAVRLTIDPGARLPSDANDPTGGMFIVESGTFTIRADAPLAISRSGSLNAAIATAEATGTFTPSDEQIGSGEEATMTAGDAAYLPANTGGEIRNDGSEPAVALVVLMAPTEAMTGATPVP
jgi:quercetin dioxygenase-like cupin family protein